MFFKLRASLGKHAPATLLVAACFGLAFPASAADRVNLDGLQSADEHDKFIVKYKEGSLPRQNDAALAHALQRAARAVPASHGRALGIAKLHRMAIGADVIKTHRKLDDVEAEILMRQIASDPNVVYIEVDQQLHVNGEPTDPRFFEQWGLHGTYGINADEAWSLSQNPGAGVVVAVIDTGIQAHEDLSVLNGYDFIEADEYPGNGDSDGWDSDPTEKSDDDCPVAPPVNPCMECPIKAAEPMIGHGTHVAGIIAATRNSKGVVGVAYNAGIVPIRVINSCGNGTLSALENAIDWAIGEEPAGASPNANPANVINISLGFLQNCPTSLNETIENAVAQGVVVVVAAGNDGGTSLEYPASCGNVISVAATDSTGARWSESNFGDSVDLAAPGVGILSTQNQSYVKSNGTSMAAPHVSGTVALMQSARAQSGAATVLSPSQVESILWSTGRPMATAERLVDAGAAVEAAVICRQDPVDSGVNCDGEADVNQWQIVDSNANDANNDGRSDVFWHSGPNEQMQPWLMNGSQWAYGLVKEVSNQYEVAGVGDFDNNGLADVLWRNEAATELWVWIGQAGGTYAVTYLRAYPTGWDIVGVGDSNADGRSDIFWHNRTSDQMQTWLMNGATWVYGPLRPTPNAVVRAVGDFSGDGRADVIWHDQVSAGLSIWQSNGESFVDAYLRQYPNGWSIAAIVDSDSDGKLDIFWHNPSAGKVQAWLMDGTTWTYGEVHDVSNQYEVAAAGDYNGDGLADLLWRDTQLTEVWVWLARQSGGYEISYLRAYPRGWEPAHVGP